MSHRGKGVTDEHALRMIAEGRIVCDPATGVILVDGIPRGFRSNGYQRIYCAGVSMQSHRVVWMFVHGPIPDGYVINHRDGNRKNNRIANLEAVTHRQNVLHAHRHPAYRGTYPEDTVDATVAARVAELAARPHEVTRQELLAIVGVEPDEVRNDTEALMQTVMDIEPRIPHRRLA